MLRKGIYDVYLVPLNLPSWRSFVRNRLVSWNTWPDLLGIRSQCGFMQGAQAAGILEQAQLTFGVAIFPMLNLHGHQTRVATIAISTSANVGACHKSCKICKSCRGVEIFSIFSSTRNSLTILWGVGRPGRQIDFAAGLMKVRVGVLVGVNFLSNT